VNPTVYPISHGIGPVSQTLLLDNIHKKLEHKNLKKYISLQSDLRDNFNYGSFASTILEIAKLTATSVGQLAQQSLVLGATEQKQRYFYSVLTAILHPTVAVLCCVNWPNLLPFPKPPSRAGVGGTQPHNFFYHC
jgi:hypothetical protein